MNPVEERLKEALSEMVRIQNGELPKRSAHEMLAQIRTRIKDGEEGESTNDTSSAD